MGLGVVTSFSTPASGTCVYCRRSRLVIQPVEGEAGVCDVCSYALRGAWQEAQGERLLATSPRLVKTYVLVPRLKKDRSFLDVSSYEIPPRRAGPAPVRRLHSLGWRLAVMAPEHLPGGDLGG